MKQGSRIALDPDRKSNDANDFHQELSKRVVGQPEAVSLVCDLMGTYWSGLTPPSRPMGNALFLGPTGTGKTHVVESLASILFGDDRCLLKVDCGEFQHSHEIAKLIGSPPGYLGHRETHPLFTQDALNQWHNEKLKLSIILFDEIEKASDSLTKLLLGILDKATLTLGDNRRIDFTRCLIFMTSNLGARDMNSIEDGGIGFVKGVGEVSVLDGKLSKAATDAAKRKFSPEFMNRIDRSVVFHPLAKHHLNQILDLEMSKIQFRILHLATPRKFTFGRTAAVDDFLLDLGTDRKYGARHLKRVLENKVVVPFSNLLTTGQIDFGDVVQISLHHGRLRFDKIPGDCVQRLSAREWGDFQTPVEET